MIAGIAGCATSGMAAIQLSKNEVREALYPVRDQVLDRACLRPGDTLLDVGTGDGLIALGALDRLGPDGRVIFSDISAHVLEFCRAAVTAAGQST
jgi:ubiquinone/menaquinone biosynthesis C-methylase UbiE